MNIKDKKVIKVFVLLLILFALPLAVFLVRRVANLKPEAQVPSVNFYLQPGSGEIANGSTIRLFVNPSSQKLVFIKAVLTFDKNKIQLTTPVNISSSAFSTEVQKSTTSEANSSGRIVIVVAAPPGVTSPTASFELANFSLNKLSTLADDTTAITVTEIQVTDENALVMAPTATHAAYVLNPSPAGISNCVNNLVVNDAGNRADWHLRTNLQQGDSQFGDRAYTLTTVPAGYRGISWIQTANDSKSYTGATATAFTLAGSGTVYVAHDDRIGTKPSWMSSWTNTNEDLVNSESPAVRFSIYSKQFNSGASVSLGNNGSTGSDMYTILVRCDGGAAVTPIPLGTLISRGRTVTASATYSGTSPANVVDGNETTNWNAGARAPQWIQIDLGSARSVRNIRLKVNQEPSPANTIHRIYTGSVASSLTQVKEFNGATTTQQWLLAAFASPLTNVRYIKIETPESQSWVSWYEIEVYE